jgi:hypothetical protein
MDEHELEVFTEPAGARQTRFTATEVGAGLGGFLFVGAGLLAYVPEAALRVEAFGDLGPSAGEEIGKYLLLPGLLGVVVGSAIGWAVTITRTRRAVSPFNWTLAWGLLGGAVAVVVPAGIYIVSTWIAGKTPLTGIIGPSNAIPPMSLLAAREALATMLIGGIFFGLPLFALGSIVGIIIGLVKRA